MNLCDIREVKALLARHGFHFSKTMGQNFLTADWIPQEIAAACGADGSHGVLEVGPGVGCLTRELCQRAAAVVSVELDRSLLPVLAETMADAENFQLINEDILKLDIPAAADRYFSGLTPLVCANLPYNITTPALRVLVEADRFETITVMVQKEVAQRIAAPAGASDYGAFSVYMQYHTEPELLFDVPPDCFLPRPKVTSAVVRCRTRTAPPVAPAAGRDFQGNDGS
ncbi:MAG: ribosomal RNA small subunit methyltransferase A [Oscillospiraceae bacterium]|nr:ribosomal RNA small subunit methyltransferase A [Oscillospiraceae bacterium]